MKVHWIPTTLKEHERDVVKHGLEAAPDLAGGSTSSPSFELLDASGAVVDTYPHDCLEDAVSTWVRRMRKESSNVHPPPPALNLPPNVVELGCTCASPDCLTPEKCIQAGVVRREAFTDAYTNSVQGMDPLVLDVRTSSSGRTRKLHVTFTPNTSPSLEELRHGVVARMHVSSRRV
jgi:hypothetical protein